MSKPNYLKLVSLLVTLLFILPACNDDDDIDITKDNMVGTWQYKWLERDYDDYYDDDDYDYEEDLTDENWYLILKQDGSFTEEYRLSGGTERDNGNWTLTNNTLRLNFTDYNETEIFTVIELTKDRLRLEKDDSSGSYKRYRRYTLHKR